VGPRTGYAYLGKRKLIDRAESFSPGLIIDVKYLQHPYLNKEYFTKIATVGI
jgi:hypothetical protein